MYYEVTEVTLNGSDVNMQNESKTVYWLTESDVLTTLPGFSPSLLWIYGVLMEIIPSCILLVLFICFIVKLCCCHGEQQNELREDQGLIHADMEGIKNDDNVGTHGIFLRHCRFNDGYLCVLLCDQKWEQL